MGVGVQAKAFVRKIPNPWERDTKPNRMHATNTNAHAHAHTLYNPSHSHRHAAAKKAFVPLSE